MTEAPTRLSTPCGGGGQAVQENPRQFRKHWAEFMAPLPRQILTPLRRARCEAASLRARRVNLHSARQALHAYVGDLAQWFASVDEMMARRGVEYVDSSDPLQAAAFLDRLGDSGRRALAKRQKVETAIAYARMTIERLEWELRDGR